MATIEEDYVSFETAKLLKEKGFDIGVRYYYQKIDDDITYNIGDFRNWNLHDIWYSMPTLQMAMKWLREVHKLVICAEIGNENDKGNTDYSNPDRWYWFFDITNEKGVVIDTESDYVLNEYFSYEQACEAAIKYCLENLI